jgi:hypothetical protein
VLFMEIKMCLLDKYVCCLKLEKYINLESRENLRQYSNWPQQVFNNLNLGSLHPVACVRSR